VHRYSPKISIYLLSLISIVICSLGVAGYWPSDHFQTRPSLKMARIDLSCVDMCKQSDQSTRLWARSTIRICGRSYWTVLINPVIGLRVFKRSSHPFCIQFASVSLPFKPGSKGIVLIVCVIEHHTNIYIQRQL